MALITLPNNGLLDSETVENAVFNEKGSDTSRRLLSIPSGAEEPMLTFGADELHIHLKSREKINAIVGEDARDIADDLENAKVPVFWNMKKTSKPDDVAKPAE